jgi:RHS repeat-associated protein
VLAALAVVASLLGNGPATQAAGRTAARSAPVPAAHTGRLPDVPDPAAPPPVKPLSAAPADTSAGPAVYAYDAMGRLAGVTHPGGQSAQYTYDAAGNELGVTQYPSSQLAVLSVVPAAARPGDVITIHGTGFSPTAASDMVTFGFLNSGQVLSASANTLTVKVPSGVATGPLSVMVGFTSAQGGTFTVATPPAISGFFPAQGPPGSTVVLTGSGFSGTATDDVVTVNGVRAQVNSANPNMLSITTPVSGTGPIQVTTPIGRAATATAFGAQVAAGNPAVIDATTRAEVDGPGQSVAIGTAGRSALVLFDTQVPLNTQNPAVSAAFTGSSLGDVAVSIYDSAGNLVTGPTTVSGDDSLDYKSGLQSGKDYQMLITPTSASATGRVTVTLSTIAWAPELSPTGAGTTVSITRPGQQVAATFPANAAAVSIGLTGNTIPTTLSYQVWALDGTVAATGTLPAKSSGSILVTLPEPSIYAVQLRAGNAATGSVTVTLSAPVLDTLTAGTPATETIARPGQYMGLLFSGTTGASMNLGLSGNTFPDTVYYEVGAPDGTILSGTTGSIPAGAPATISLPNLPQTGTYGLILVPANAVTGSVQVLLRNGTAASSKPAAAPAPPPGMAQLGKNTVLAANSPAKAEAAFAPSDRAGSGKSASNTSDTSDTSGKASADKGSPHSSTAGEIPAKGGAFWQPDQGNLNGVDWLIRRAAPPADAPLRAPAGITAVSGVVRTLDGKPLAKVTVSVGAKTTTTDGQGRFLLAGVGFGDQTLDVDGSTASDAGHRYGYFAEHLVPTAGQTSVLPYTIWMTQLDTQNIVRFPSPTTREVVLTTPKIPGLQVHIPAGSVIKDESGKVVDELGITPIPIDRPPFPLPSNGIIPVFFTVQPGGTYVLPAGAWVVYPNYTHLPAGKRVDFWDYDPAHLGWHIYGHGQVSADGMQVVPDKGTRVWSFYGAMFNSGLPAQDPVPDPLPTSDAGGGEPGAPADPATGPEPPQSAGDPVDLATGQVTDQYTDLSADDVMPIQLTRSYYGGDSVARSFGVGVLDNYDLFLHSQLQYQEVDLFVPGGSSVHYTRTSPGLSYADAVFAATGTSGAYQGSTISWSTAAGGWDLALRNGLTYHFPDLSRATSITDRNGNKVTLDRDQAGDLTRITSPNGRWIKLTYNSSYQVTGAQDNIGRTVSYTYDSAGHLTYVREPDGGQLGYTYDAGGHLLTAMDARGITYISNTYDATGRVSQQTTTDGQKYSFAYTLDSTGKATEVRVTQPTGAVQRTTFDANSAVASITEAFGDPLARTTTFTRGAAGEVDTSTDPYGRTTTFHYDSAGRLTYTTFTPTTGSAVDGPKTVWGAYDLPASVTDQLGKTVSYSRDGQGNLIKIVDALGRVTTVTYNSAGQPLTLTDPAGKITTYGYSGGDPVSVTDPLGDTSRQFVDAAGRVTAATAPTGAASSVALDARDDVTTATDALGQSVGYAYDGNGDLTSLTDQRENIWRWVYDSSDRLIQTTDPLYHSTTAAYDNTGRLTSNTDADGKTTAYTYDALDRVVRTDFGIVGTGSPESTVATTYSTTSDSVAQVGDTVAAGPSTFTYDGLDRLTKVVQPTGTIGYGYDADNRRTSMTAGQTQTVYTYDDSGALTNVAQGSVSAAPHYDGAGREAGITLPGGWSQNYAYDDASQITGVAYAYGSTSKGTLTYTRDPQGQVSSVGGSLANVTLPAPVTNYSYDGADRLTFNSNGLLDYDNAGNLTGDGTNTYTWNSRGQLTGLTNATSSTTFRYTATGSRDRVTSGGTTTGTLNDGGNPAAELDGTGATTASLLSAGVDQWLARTTSAGTQTYLTDPQGSTVALGAPDGTLSASYSYDPYGGTTTTGTTGGNTLTYTGRQSDPTGLDYYRARYYSPSLGRFISKDPAGLANGTNPYAYALDDPANVTDPSGATPDPGRSQSTNVPEESAPEGSPCSFDPSTPVLMADGSTKPIGQVKNGDQVESADPTTAKDAGGRTVQHLWVNHDSDLVDVTVDDGKGHTSVLHTTANHPFYDDSTHTFVRADHLKAGDELASTNGHLAFVAAVTTTPGSADRDNLTVEQLHTYYVMAGGTPVLVHNKCPNHLADVSSYDSEGTARGENPGEPGPATYYSGRGLPTERAQGPWKGGVMATHTEARATRAAGSPWPFWATGDDPVLGSAPATEGDTYYVEGQLPPCSWCQIAMEEAAVNLNTTWVYTWLDNAGLQQFWWRGPNG